MRGSKISFTTRQGSALTAVEQDDMATAIASDWAQRVFVAQDLFGL
jgi:hypothetical protein